MRKIKKLYCKASLLLSVLMLSVALSLSFGFTSKATEYGATDNAPNASDSVTGSGGTGFTLSFDGDTGSLNSTVEILLILTVYENHRGVTFY